MSGSETRFAVLLFTDIVDSTESKARHGVPAYTAALRTHNDHFERVARECLNPRTLQSRGDGYFAEAGSVAEAVRFALLFQEAMRAEPWGGVRLETRIGIHAGEVGALDAGDGTWIVGPAADLAARVTDLAVGGQILLTRFPFDEARHFIREHPPVAGKAMPPLRWLAHGPYLLKGRDEPLEIFEVGAEGLAPLGAPPDGAKAKRAIRPGEEETLGWRPAVGLEIPGRTGWQLTTKLGAGGFGEVWVGEHAKLHQRRAFKFCFDDERLRALKREVTLVRLLRTALGERDDIVHIHELKLDAPPFYLESDLAPHGNLLQWAERQGGLDKIPLVQRIALVAHTATALAAAHSIGVLHKDIKPTNILIFDGPGGEPRPRLVDFGIGTLADPSVLREHGISGPSHFTRVSLASSGTPTYSPPEYLAGRPYTIQGDIYGLGVLLWQLITIKPFDPLAPGWERDIPDSLLREDIAACVDGDPARRLPSASDLADRLWCLDVRHAEIVEKERLAREAVALAEAEAAAREARLRATRLRKLAAAFGVLAMLAIAGGALAWMNQQKADMAYGEVARKKAEVDRTNDEYRAMLVEAARSDRFVASEKLRTGGNRTAFAHLARACEYDPRSTLAAEMVAVALNTWRHCPPVGIFVGHEDPVLSAQFSPDGLRIITASEDNTALIWDAATGEILTILAEHEDIVWSGRFSPDGSRIVTASWDNSGRLWDAATGKVIAILAGHNGVVWDAQFSPDGSRIVTASADNTARVWDAVTGQWLHTLTGHGDGVRSAQFSPGGTRIVTASEDNDARLWDAATGNCLATLAGHEDALWNAQFSPDGSRIVTSSRDTTARLWDAETGASLVTLAGHENGVWSAEFSPNGSRIVTVSEDNTGRLWDSASGKSLATLTGHEDGVLSGQFSPNGSRIVTASDDGSVRLWDAANGKSLVTLAGHEKSVRRAQFSPDGSRIVTASKDKTARLCAVQLDIATATLAKHEVTVWSAEFSPDGRRVVTASEDNSARVWEVATGAALTALVGHTDGVRSAQFSPDGSRIVTASDDSSAQVWDAASGKSLLTLTGHEDSVNSAQFSPDGLRIVTASADTTARVWNAVTGQWLHTLTGHGDGVRSAQFSPDGSHIVTASEDNTARLWNATIGTWLTTLAGHTDEVWSARFSLDGLRVVTASWDQTARVWDPATGTSLATLVGHDDGVFNAQFSPDGSRIITASWDNSVRVWDAATGKNLATLVGHDDGVLSARYSPDGSHIVTASEDTTARVWGVLPPSAGPPPAWFPDFLRYLAQMRLNSDGELETLKPDDWLALRERMRAVRRAGAGQDTPYLRILLRYVPE